MYLNKVTIRNFKRIKEQTFHFTDFDLLIGNNNSGKSTILQAVAIWQYCVEEFQRAKRKGSRGIQIVLPNFTALPLPEFNLLWTDKTDRKKQEFIYIEIIVNWLNSDGTEGEFGIRIRYQSPQAVYAIPIGEWQTFNSLNDKNLLPHIVYVPPFSGLEPNEIWYDDGIIRKYIGKAQPGSVLRNLLFSVVDRTKLNEKGETIPLPIKENHDWNEITKLVKDWFGVTLNPPQYEKGISTEIKVTYTPQKGKNFDIIAAGSGFHQILTLLAFFYGLPNITTILFDEPDAHLHVNLQRKILSYFKSLRKVQFLIATHAEEFIKGVEVSSILSILANEPKRIEYLAPIITALSEIDNMTVIQTTQSPFILYVEGEDDERIIKAWAQVLNKTELLSLFYIEKMGGSSKKMMRDKAEKHFKGLQQIVPAVKRIMLFDYDSDETAFNVAETNPVVVEWKRKNIDNYLLVPTAWERAVLNKLNLQEANFFSQPILQIINEFFEEQNLSLPKRSSWKNVVANIFKEVNGKKILFENPDSLFQRIRKLSGFLLNRETIASTMLPEELHEDIETFLKKLEIATN